MAFWSLPPCAVRGGSSAWPCAVRRRPPWPLASWPVCASVAADVAVHRGRGRGRGRGRPSPAVVLLGWQPCTMCGIVADTARMCAEMADRTMPTQIGVMSRVKYARPKSPSHRRRLPAACISDRWRRGIGRHYGYQAAAALALAPLLRHRQLRQTQYHAPDLPLTVHLWRQTWFYKRLICASPAQPPKIVHLTQLALDGIGGI